MPTRIPEVVADVPTLIVVYRQTAIDRAAALDDGDTRTGNRHFDRINRLWKRLTRQPGGLAAVCRLMADPHPGVRLMAAAHAYLSGAQILEAERVLVELAKGIGFTAAAASHSLVAWNLGPHRQPVH
jgi:hypothetical protein